MRPTPPRPTRLNYRGAAVPSEAEFARGAWGEYRETCCAVSTKPGEPQQKNLTHELLGERRRDGDLRAAAAAFGDAEKAHDRVGDAIRARTPTAPALLGAGEEAGSAESDASLRSNLARTTPTTSCCSGRSHIASSSVQNAAKGDAKMRQRWRRAVFA